MRRRPGLAWAAILPLDITLALVGASACVVLCLSEVQPLVDKARLTGMMLQTTGPRFDIAEHLALTGWLERAGPVAEDDDGKSTPFSSRDAGTGYVMKGRLRSGEEPVEISFRPSWIASEAATNVVWLCGDHRPLEGWAAPPAPKGSKVPPGRLFFPCRDAQPL